jgi:hypothetical protein
MHREVIKQDKIKGREQPLTVSTVKVLGEYKTAVLTDNYFDIDEVASKDEQAALEAHEKFIRKYKKPEPKPLKMTGKYLLLIDALRRAAELARPLDDTEDGGTCNFDSLQLDLPGYREAEVLEAAKQAGLRAFATKIFKQKVFVVNVPVARQGNARTRQAESMKKTMRELGYDASVYYQMD